MNIDSKTHFSKSKVKNIKEVVVNDKMKNNNNKRNSKRKLQPTIPPIATCFAQIPLYMYKNIDLKECLPNQLKMTENCQSFSD